MRSRRIVPAPVANATEVPFAALADEWLAIQRDDGPASETDAECDARVDAGLRRQDEIVRTMIATPATTPAGIAEKVRIARTDLCETGTEYDDERIDRLLESAERDLRSLAALSLETSCVDA